MNRTLFSKLSVTTILLLAGISSTYAQNSPKKSIKNPVKQEIKGISLDNYQAFKQEIMPLIEVMGTKKIVGLGEGTHGTAEFYKLRFWISRILVEEKGFRHIAFENDLGDTWLLNQQLAQSTNLDSLMRKHLFGIWQNKETKAMLNWLKEYNRTNSSKVTIDGLDYSFLKPDVRIIERILSNIPAFKSSLDSLRMASEVQDNAWEGMNKAGYQLDFPALTKSSYEAYLIAEKINKQLTNMDLSPQNKQRLKMALENFQQGTSPFYAMTVAKPEMSRDQILAINVGKILTGPSDKMIIWAHNAHLAKTAVFNNEVGGAGGDLLKAYPKNYFVLGTGTATGTFTATTDDRITYNSPMTVAVLDSPEKNSWEYLWSNTGLATFYFNPLELNKTKSLKPMRFVGYGADSSPKKNSLTNISDLFDAFLFVKDSHAATPLDK